MFFAEGMSLNSYSYNLPKSIKLQDDNGQTKFEFVAMETGLKLQPTRGEDKERAESITIDMLNSSGRYITIGKSFV